MTNPPTLSEMTEALTHAIPGGFSTPGMTKLSTSTGESKKGRGGGKFDESKVKRDGEGQFARKAAADDVDPQKDWEANIEAKLEKIVADKFGGQAESIFKKSMNKYGFKSVKEVVDAPEAKQAKVQLEYANSIATVINDYLRVTPKLSLSPSGTQRVAYSVVTDDDGKPDVVLRTFSMKTGMPLKVLTHSEPLEDELSPPTFAEMRHAIELYQTNPEAYLQHYGVKGMKWGVRRSRDFLARAAGISKKAVVGTKDEEGNTVGGIRAASRAGAQKLKDMKDGETLILTDAEGASKIMSKQKDGTFKEVYLSADAERVLRTSKKAESELSDVEITAAINRAKKIDEYNKIFNREANPNAELQAKFDALQLQVNIRKAESMLNPPKEKLVSKFINQVKGGYSGYKSLDDTFDGKLNGMMKDLISEMGSSRAASTSTMGKVADAAATARAASKAKKAAEDRFWSGSDSTSTSRGSYRTPTASEQKRVNDFVYDITSMGKEDANNPYYNRSTPISPPAPSYPELER